MPILSFGKTLFVGRPDTNENVYRIAKQMLTLVAVKSADSIPNRRKSKADFSTLMLVFAYLSVAIMKNNL